MISPMCSKKKCCIPYTVHNIYIYTVYIFYIQLKLRSCFAETIINLIIISQGASECLSPWPNFSSVALLSTQICSGWQTLFLLSFDQSITPADRVGKFAPTTGRVRLSQPRGGQGESRTSPLRGGLSSTRQLSYAEWHRVTLWHTRKTQRNPVTLGAVWKHTNELYLIHSKPAFTVWALAF